MNPSKVQRQLIKKNILKVNKKVVDDTFFA